MDWSNNRNLTMLVDFYELTMGNGYLKEGIGNKRAVFDMFFRKVPDKAGFAICAGLEQLVGYLQNLHFSEEDIASSGAKRSSARHSLTTCGISNFPATSGR